MKTIGALLLLAVLSSFTGWETNFEKAKQTAQTEHKFILLNFSGSDWCGPCIRLHKEYLDTDAFIAFAKNKLVLVNADFPRQKKNQLAKELQKQNDQLADRYNANGAFPLTVLISPDGKLIKTWDGVPKMSATEFMEEVKNTIAE